MSDQNPSTVADELSRKGVQIVTVTGRRQRSDEAVKITSRNPRLHVMGLRRKFGNIHVVLSRPPTGGHRKGYVMRSSAHRRNVFRPIKLAPAPPRWRKPRITVD